MSAGWKAVHMHPTICAEEIAQLEREREEDRRAIRALRKALSDHLAAEIRCMPGEHFAEWTAALNESEDIEREHSLAIQRATQAPA